MVSPKLSLLHQSQALRLALDGDVFLISWTAPRVDKASMAELIEVQTRMTEGRIEPYAILSLIDGARTTGIDDDARERIRAHEQAMASSVVTQAQVVLGSGFMATGTRAAIAGISLVTRTPYPVRVFAEVPPAASYLASTLETVSAARLTQSVSALLAP